MSRRSLVALVAALVLVVGLGVGAYTFWPRSASPITEEEALDRFRERAQDAEAGQSGEGAQGGESAQGGEADGGEVDGAGSAPGAEPAASRPEVALPAAGVYTFTTTGGEDVKLGMLPTETRTYPSTVTAIVVADSDVCATVTLNLLEQHTEDTTYCTTPTGGLRIDRHVKHQKVGSLSPTATMTCDPGMIFEPEESALDPSCILELAGGPAQLTADVDGNSRSVAGEVVEVDGAEVAATKVELRYVISGDLTGTWTEDIWFADHDRTPLRIERQLDLNGLATFNEDSTLALTSLEPVR